MMMTRYRTCVIEQGCQQMLQLCEEECEIGDRNVDHKCLQKYDQNNEHFSMKVVSFTGMKKDQERITYRCKYRYGSHEVKLEYDVTSEKWKLAYNKHLSEEIQLKLLIERVNKFTRDNRSLTLEKIIEHLLEVFDGHFLEIDQIMNKRLKSSLKGEKQRVIECAGTESCQPKPPKRSTTDDDDKLELLEETFFSSSTDSTDDEEEEEDKGDLAFLEGENISNYDSYFSKHVADQNCYEVEKPPITPRLSRPNSAEYTSLVPVPTASVRRRHVIESILLHVHRKKKIFEKLVDVVKKPKISTIYMLGLEFLRVYDGKFNYREGHTFVMSYQKKIWFLTIIRINCVDCPVGDIEPRSKLILSYKGRYALVHV